MIPRVRRRSLFDRVSIGVLYGRLLALAIGVAEWIETEFFNGLFFAALVLAVSVVVSGRFVGRRRHIAPSWGVRTIQAVVVLTAAVPPLAIGDVRTALDFVGFASLVVVAARGLWRTVRGHVRQRVETRPRLLAADEPHRNAKIFGWVAGMMLVLATAEDPYKSVAGWLWDIGTSLTGGLLVVVLVARASVIAESRLVKVLSVACFAALAANLVYAATHDWTGESDPLEAILFASAGCTILAMLTAGRSAPSLLRRQ
jgi:hypothetical protein